MDKKDFIEWTERLERFHEKKLNDEQSKEWWNTFENANVGDYREAVRKGMNNSRYLPKLIDMIEYVEQAKKEREAIPVVDNEHPVYECDICHGKGYVFFWRNVGEQWSQAMCRCKCKNGDYVYPKGLANFSKLNLQLSEKKQWFDPFHHTYEEVYGGKNNAFHD